MGMLLKFAHKLENTKYNYQSQNDQWGTLYIHVYTCSMYIYIYTCCGTYLICLNCNLWYMYSQQMMQSQYQFSFLLPPPPAITSDLAAYVVPFWWTPFSVGFTYLNKKKSEFVLWCSIKTIYVSSECMFVRPWCCLPGSVSVHPRSVHPWFNSLKVLLILIQD